VNKNIIIIALAAGLAASLAVAGYVSISTGSADDSASLRQQLAGANAKIKELQSSIVQSPTLTTKDVLYAFAPEKIAVIEPKSASIVKTISTGLVGVEWADPILSPDGRLVFVNDRANAKVIVIDAEEHEVIKKIPVGPRPVHIYNPLHGNEIWTHSDEEGAFYVIDTNSIEVTSRVVAALNNTGHGKLRYHETLGNKAYATNSNDPAVFVINLQNKSVTKTIKLCETEEGTGGTHGKAYSPYSKHAYFECSRTGKTAVLDTTTDTLVKYLDGSGQLFETPDERFVVIMDKRNSKVHVIDATRGSEIIASIPVEGGADKIYFHEKDGRLYGFTANTLTPDSAVIDFQEMKVVKRIAAGDIERPEGAAFLHRGGDSGGGFFFTEASGDGVVAIIDVESQTLHAAVPLKKVDHVMYVGKT
jgi:YVTN family beta-propeller protein